MEYIIIIAAVCALEIFLRRMANQKLELNEKKELPGYPISLNRHHNYGMAENRMEERPALVKAIGIAVMALLVAVFAATLPLRGKKGLKIGLALVMGGGLANLAERFLHGYVTDYFQLKVPCRRIRRLIFNAADFCIFIGGVLMLFSELRKQD